MTTTDSIPQEAVDLKPCPFCGGKASVGHYETESLWSHDQVTYTQVGCSSCDIEFSSEPGYEVEAPEAWNTRTLLTASTDPQASAPGGLRETLTRIASLQEAIEVRENGTYDDYGRGISYQAGIVASEIREALLAPSPQREGGEVAVTYTNWRGETAERTITPVRMWFGSTEWHPEPQWLIEAHDHEKDALRDFALTGFATPAPEQAHQAASRDMVLVPREPTEAMHNAARDWSYAKYGKPVGKDASDGCYRAMIDAALTPANAAGER